MPGPDLSTENKAKILSHEQLMNFTVKETINDMLEICAIKKSKWRWGIQSFLARAIREALLRSQHLNKALKEVRESYGCLQEEHSR